MKNTEKIDDVDKGSHCIEGNSSSIVGENKFNCVSLNIYLCVCVLNVWYKSTVFLQYISSMIKSVLLNVSN